MMLSLLSTVAVFFPIEMGLEQCNCGVTLASRSMSYEHKKRGRIRRTFSRHVLSLQFGALSLWDVFYGGNACDLNRVA